MKIKINSRYFIPRIKLNWNCPESEKSGTGPGSCGGNSKTSDIPEFGSYNPHLESVPTIRNEMRKTILELQDLERAMDDSEDDPDISQKELNTLETEHLKLTDKMDSLRTSFQKERQNISKIRDDLSKEFSQSSNKDQSQWIKYGGFRFKETRFEHQIGSCEINQLNSVKQANILSDEIKKFNVKCKSMGIPPIRGVGVTPGVAHTAQMGDGILTVEPDNLESSSYISREFMANDLKAEQSRMDKFTGEMATLMGRKKPQNIDALDPYKEPLRRYFEDKDDGLMPWSWTPESQAIKPYWTSMFFESPEEQEKATLIHEFAHHEHQYYGTKEGNIGINSSPVEQISQFLYEDRNRNNDPSEYCMTNAHEWFAENRTLWNMNRRDLVSREIKPLFDAMDNKKKLSDWDEDLLYQMKTDYNKKDKNS